MNTDTSQIYVVRLRFGKSVVPDWPDRLLVARGITLISAAGRQAEIRCSPQDILRITEDLGPDFLIEKVLSRRPL